MQVATHAAGSRCDPALLVVALVALTPAIFRDWRVVPCPPLWATYSRLWAGLLSMPVSLIFCFKNGPLVWSDLIVFYCPVLVFFIWVVDLMALAMKSVCRGAARPPAAA